jgi:hypothetical protein
VDGARANSIRAPMAARASLRRLDGMNDILSSPLSPLLLVAVAVFVIVRQLAPQAIRPRSLLVVPLVAGYLGFQGLTGAPPAGVLAIGLLAVNLVLAVGLGALRGATMRVWQSASGAWMSQGTLVTLGLWLALIAVRLAMAVLDRGALPLQEIGLVVAATFGAQNLIVWLRTQSGAAAVAERQPGL